MHGTWVSVALLVCVGFGCDSSRRRSEPTPTPAPGSEAREHAGKDAGAAIDARPAAPAPKPAPAAPLNYTPGDKQPLESLLEVIYSPDESLSDKLRRRIRFRLNDRSRAPIALHHIITIPKADGGREVFALYESSVYEDCVQRYVDRKKGRDHCLGELVTVFDHEGDPTPEERRTGAKPYRFKQVRLNRACLAVGAVRAVFGPPRPGEDADTGGTLAITSFAFTDTLCEVTDYNRVLVADLDGDHKLEMYVDITSAQEELGEVRGPRTDGVPATIRNVRQHLYILSGDNLARPALSIDLDGVMFPNDPAPEDLVELRDIDRDGHLDVIEAQPCFMTPMPGAVAPCESEPAKRTAYLYDVAKDSYKEGVAMISPPKQAVPAAAPEGTPAPDDAPAPEEPHAAAPAPAPTDTSKTAPEAAPAPAASGGAARP